jgi:hypothetical protein
MELGEEDEPVVGNNDNVDMFGFKMPDNFDLPDDFYSDIRFVNMTLYSRLTSMQSQPRITYSNRKFTYAVTITTSLLI